MITINKIHIKNFRSIVDETLDFKDFTCFVGKNDSGKSNVLKALNLFFNNETDYGTPLSFKDDYSLFAKRGQHQAKEITIEIEVNIPKSFKENGLKWWKRVWREEGLHSDNTNDIFNSGSRGQTFLNRIRYLYIPAVKSNDYFKSLLANMYTSMTQTADDALKKLNAGYSAELQKLTSALTEEIRRSIEIESSLQMPANLSVLFRDLSFSTSDSNVKDIDLSHRGDGVKARHIPLILRFIQNNTETNRKKGSVYGSYIWGFEEPENGVEYLSCYEMANEFLSYLDSCQILVTTHSPAFYSKGISDCSTCLLTQKENGVSSYTVDDGNNVNTTMGLMQIVSPFVEAAMKEYINDTNNEQHNLADNMRKVMNIMRRNSEKLDVKQVLSILEQYSVALDMLDDYDHERMLKPEGTESTYKLEYEECRELIDSMKFSAESDLFGNEKDDSFKGCLGSIYQSFGGIDLYPSVEEKAANLLYFITKDHAFSDGNKRIAAAVFLYFLEKNELLFRDGEKIINDQALVAIVVMIAESNPDEKETIIKLLMNFINGR